MVSPPRAKPPEFEIQRRRRWIIRELTPPSSPANNIYVLRTGGSALEILSGMNRGARLLMSSGGEDADQVRPDEHSLSVADQGRTISEEFTRLIAVWPTGVTIPSGNPIRVKIWHGLRAAPVDFGHHAGHWLINLQRGRQTVAALIANTVVIYDDATQPAYWARFDGGGGAGSPTGVLHADLRYDTGALLNTINRGGSPRQTPYQFLHGHFVQGDGGVPQPFEVFILGAHGETVAGVPDTFRLLYRFQSAFRTGGAGTPFANSEVVILGVTHNAADDDTLSTYGGGIWIPQGGIQVAVGIPGGTGGNIDYELSVSTGR